MLHLPRPPTWNQAFSPFHPQNEEYWTEQGRIAPLSPVGSIALEPSLDAGAGQNGGACRERVLGERPMCCLFRAAPVGQPVGVTIAYFQKALILLVGVAGFEPATPSSRMRGLIGKFNDSRRVRRRSFAFVPVWLRRGCGGVWGLMPFFSAPRSEFAL